MSTQPLSIFAATAPGLEPLAAAELAGLGIAAEAVPGGVAWSGDTAQLYAANLHLRTASRVMVRLGEFRARSFFELERHADKLPWERYLAPRRPFRLRVTCRKSRLYHEGAVAERFREAIHRRTAALEATASAGDDEGDNDGHGEQLFVIRFHRDHCTVSADASGALLHLRGYRQALARAPLRESLAAAMLIGSGWHGQAPLLDPMCGSGTIAIEAALLARRIAPGLAGGGFQPRDFAFLHWPDLDAEAWNRVVTRAMEAVRPGAGVPLLALDRDHGAIEAAGANAARAGVEVDLTLAASPLSALEPPAERGWLVTNPPYGVRVGESEDLRDLYAALGNVARARLPGWWLALLSADRRLDGRVGLHFREVLRTRNGGIAVRLLVGRIAG